MDSLGLRISLRIHPHLTPPLSLLIGLAEANFFLLVPAWAYHAWRRWGEMKVEGYVATGCPQKLIVRLAAA